MLKEVSDKWLVDISCPYCKAMLEVQDEFEHFNGDGDICESDCPKCGKELSVIICFSTSFRVVGNDGEDK